ncbi:hypothetical protein [Rodentibacter heidelbergensis]|uniref:Uncharacterized protein n=1 Tax=Rodentibacter heidelbergensis TaxID=1908258 RepID=A0A1V3IC81_9PAST|nr:hypothetical protein [Rodentibacter heidelbergensis]OOF37536.1 hypothetical protein BKK48_00990 [Rodentibacter heidelbergensis]
MNRDEAFKYLNERNNTGLKPDGANFKILYEYSKKDRDLFMKAFQLAYGEHGLDVYFNDIHYRVINSEQGLFWKKDGDFIGNLLNKFLGPYYAEVLLMREQEMIIDSGNVNINNVAQITINTKKAIVSIKSNKSEIINNSYVLERNDFIKLINSIENIENNLLDNNKQDINDLNFLEQVKEKVPKLSSFIADIITIASPFL